MNDVMRIYTEIIEHCKAIRELADTLEKRYGIRMCSIEPLNRAFDDNDRYIDVSHKIHVYAGFKEFIQKLGFSDNMIKGMKPHFHVWRENVEICTVTDGSKHIRSAARRNNKWTRDGK